MGINKKYFLMDKILSKCAKAKSGHKWGSIAMWSSEKLRECRRMAGDSGGIVSA